MGSVDGAVYGGAWGAVDGDYAQSRWDRRILSGGERVYGDWDSGLYSDGERGGKADRGGGLGEQRLSAPLRSRFSFDAEIGWGYLEVVDVVVEVEGLVDFCVGVEGLEEVLDQEVQDGAF
jgi:hypothetical protein